MATCHLRISYFHTVVFFDNLLFIPRQDNPICFPIAHRSGDSAMLLWATIRELQLIISLSEIEAIDIPSLRKEEVPAWERLSLSLVDRLEWERGSPNSTSPFFFLCRGGELDLLLSFAPPSPDESGEDNAPSIAPPYAYCSPLLSFFLDDEPLPCARTLAIMPFEKACHFTSLSLAHRPPKGLSCAI